jgi:DNA-binding CsgD family transcriptional regulator
MSLPTLDRWPLIGRRIHLDDFEDALASPSTRGVVISGEAGVGKTRLADECRHAAEALGHAAVRLVGSRASAAVPLGALAHLLPSDLAPDPDDDGMPELYEQFARSLRFAGSQGVNGRRLVLMVDDLHLLDIASLALLERAVHGDVAFLLAAVRSDEPSPLASPWWESADLTRLGLDSLGKADVDTLLHLALGGPLEGSTGKQLWDVSQGNALYVRELIMGALSSGTLVDDGGVWHLRGTLTSSTRLRDLIGERVHASGPDGLAVLEWLAVSEWAGRADLEDLASAATVDALARSGLIVITEDGQRRTVTLAHSLHAEILREDMPRLRKRSLLLELANHLTDLGARRRDDAARIAIWKLEGGGRAEPVVLMAAAHLAKYAHDFAQVERLAGAVLADDPRAVDAAILLGEAHHELGHFDAAEKALSLASLEAVEQHEIVLAAGARAQNFLWGLLDPPAAIDVVEHARARLGPAAVASRNELLVEHASIRVFSGEPRAGLALLGDLEAAPDGTGTATLHTRVLRAIAEAPARALLGQTERALDLATQGLADHTELGDHLAIAHRDTHIDAQIMALVHAGRLDQATGLAATGYERAIGDRAALRQIWFALELGMIASWRGLIRSSLGWYREARARASATGFDGPLRRALSGLAQQAALLGNHLEAREAIAELDTVEGRGGTFAFLADELALGRAWLAVADRDVPAAVQLLVRHGNAAADRGYLTAAAWLWHDAARLDPDAPVVDRLIEVADGGESPLLRARAQHASAIRDRDPSALVAAGDTLESLGLALVASEALFAAADAFRLAGEQRTANTTVARAEGLLDRCEGARTPRTVRADAVVPLSKRERDIALLAAANVPSKDIAERLSLSVRTVNNHLQRAYTKLAVSSRAELAEALGLAPEDEGPTPPP